MRKKAFTLTELLVVVVIIGVLSAVVLPKFSKVIESRRTAEAESVMRAVRNEQEMRCTLDKNYTTDSGKLAVWPKRASANYTYTLNAEGMSASRIDKDYTLEMLTYLDGGICCTGTYCASLNKNYPSCDEYGNVAKANTGCAASDVDDEQEPDPNPNPEPELCDPDGSLRAAHTAGEELSTVRNGNYINRVLYDFFDDTIETCAWQTRSEQVCSPTQETLGQHSSTETSEDEEGCTVTTSWSFDENSCQWKNTGLGRVCPTRKCPEEPQLSLETCSTSLVKCGIKAPSARCSADTNWEWDISWGACNPECADGETDTTDGDDCGNGQKSGYICKAGCWEKQSCSAPATPKPSGGGGGGGGAKCLAVAGGSCNECVGEVIMIRGPGTLCPCGWKSNEVGGSGKAVALSFSAGGC